MEANFKNGYVVLPREDYDRMQLEIERLQDTLDRVITLYVSHADSTINVEYNNRLLYQLAVEQFNNHHEWKGKYELNDSISTWSNELARAIKEEQDNND